MGFLARLDRRSRRPHTYAKHFGNRILRSDWSDSQAVKTLKPPERRRRRMIDS